MTTVIEALPVRPRKASASRRRRHQTQLAHRISRIAPGAVTVLVTPLWTDPTGTAERHFVARALNAEGRFLKFEAGGSRQITALLQGAYPQANWDHPQTWTAASNTLTDRITELRLLIAIETEAGHALRTTRNFADSERSGYVNRTGIEA